MYAKTLAEHVQAYLDLQTFLDECRADGRNTERALGAVEEARRELYDALDTTRDPATGPVAEAVRAYLDAEHQFDKSMAAGADLDQPARRMERARRDLERQVHAVTGQDVQQVQAQRVACLASASQRQRRILVAYDESAPAQYALEVAVKMAEEAGGRLLLVHAVRPATGAAGEYVSSLEWLDTLHHREADEMLAKVRAGLPTALKVDLMAREGLAAEEIITAAKVWEPDMIVMGTRTRGRIAQFLLGSTAKAVIRRAPCPVMTVSRKAAWAGEGEEKQRLHAEEPAAVAT